MKDFRGMKRQRNRSRKPSTGNQNNPNRAYESNGPEGIKVRGNAQTIYEKYQQMARDANSSGDRVLAENHLQHAEHYFRMIRQMQPQRPVSEFVQRDPFSSGFDDYDDELDGDNGDSEDTTATAGDDQPQSDEPRYDNRGQGERNNGGDRDRNGNNRDRNRNDRMSGERNTGERNFKDRDNRDRMSGERMSGERMSGERNTSEPRSFEPRGDRQNNGQNHGQAYNQATSAANPPANGASNGNAIEYDADGNRRETRRERYERRRQQRFAEQEQNLNGGFAPVQAVQTPAAFIASTEPLGGSSVRAPSPVIESAPTAFDTPVVEAPASRGRPRRDTSLSDDASHLPAFLSRPVVLAAPTPDTDTPETAEAPAKPKRGRKPKEAVATSEEA